MIDTLRLTAEEARALLERGDVSGAELRAAYRKAIETRNEELNCFLTLVDGDGNDGVKVGQLATGRHQRRELVERRHHGAADL